MITDERKVIGNNMFDHSNFGSRFWRRKFPSDQDDKIGFVRAIPNLPKNGNSIRHRKRIRATIPMCNHRNNFHQRGGSTRLTLRDSSTKRNLGSC